MIALLVSIALLAFCFLVIYFLFQGPIYVPTHNRAVEQMVGEAKIRPGMKVVDLGSGDGRVAIAMAQAGAAAVGFEINPFLVWYSRYKVAKSGLQDKVTINSNSFWNQNLSEYDVVTVFGIDHVMGRLGKKLSQELKPGALVISNAFRVPGLREVKKVGSLLVYQK